jgi:hypothetical protein
MEADRAAFELARAAAEQRRREAERELRALLRSPLESWREEATWQLAACEFALEQYVQDRSQSAKQLQLAFRAACKEARHPDDVPRLRGSLQLDVLGALLDSSEPLRLELLRSLALWKRFYCSLLRGFGRFRDLAPLQGESLLALMKRTHVAALAWRPPGKPPAEELGVQSKENGRYMAGWRAHTFAGLTEATGKPISLRGTAGMSPSGAPSAI